jgi:hypothetical protein
MIAWFSPTRSSTRIEKEHGMLNVLLILICCLWVAGGACLILYTPETRRFVGGLMDEVDHRLLAGVTGLVGLLLLAAASAVTSNSPFVVFLGLVALIKAGLLFANPFDLVPRTRRWYVQEASDQTIRLFGIISLMLGTAVFSWL